MVVVVGRRRQHFPLYYSLFCLVVVVVLGVGFGSMEWREHCRCSNVCYNIFLGCGEEPIGVLWCIYSARNVVLCNTEVSRLRISQPRKIC